MQDTLVITPLDPLVNLDTLIDATVQAMPFDDPVFKYVGVIDAVKLHKFGTYVRFQTNDLVGKKWIRLERVIGFAHYEALDVEVLPAHQTDKGRYAGTVTYINVKSGYGYIYSEGTSYRFDTRNVLGGTQVAKGIAVTFASGLGLNAVSIVIPGNEKSESAYAQWAARKMAAKMQKAAS